MKKLLWLISVLECNLALAQPTSNPNFLSDFGYSNGGWRNQQTVRLAADVNGDGKADIIGYSGKGVLVSFSQGTSFGPVARLVDSDFEGWSFQNHVRTAGDINGDGKADLIAFGDAGTYAALSTGTGFGPLHLVLNDFGNVNGGWNAAVTVRCVGDVNGDGKADAIGFSGGAVRVAFSTGNALSPVKILNTDFEGWSYTDHVRTVADVDGDGKTDLVGFGSKGTFVCFSTGNGFETGKLMINDFGTDSGWNANTMRRIMADVNGDGKADILGYNTDKVVVSYSRGRGGFEAPQVISYDFSNRQGFAFDKYVVTAADVDGNRKADLIGFGDQGVIVQLTMSTTAPVVAAMAADNLCCDKELPMGYQLDSPNGRYFVVFQNDRNVVLYKKTGEGVKALWHTNTANHTTRMVMQADGNFVLYEGTRPVWASNTYGNRNAKLVMQDDGNLVIYSTDRRALWATNTAQPEEPGERDRICCDEELKFTEDLGSRITSANGKYFLVFQKDRNLVVYKKIPGDAKALWGSATNNNANRTVMQADGNLVIYNGTRPVWASNTYGNRNAKLVMQDDGNAVIYSTDGRALWATNTAQAAEVVHVDPAPVTVVAPVAVVATDASAEPCSMPEQQFNGAVHAIDAQAFRDQKMAMAKQAIKKKCLSLAQVRQIAKMFAFEDQTLEFVLYAYDFTNDKDEYYTLSDLFAFSSNVTKLNDFLNTK